MKSTWITVFIFLILSNCQMPVEKVIAEKDRALTNYVNPFIGTGGHGHTYPGATAPFGMMQLSPDTRLDGWDGCSGYHYSDSYIYGFSHTHLSGTGVSDYGDILLMPTTSEILSNGADGRPGYKAPFSHERERAEPGFYKVHLDSTNIGVELTVSERSGMHRYTFEKDSKQYVILDLEHRDEVLDSDFELVSGTEIRGRRHSRAWADQQMLYFHLRFSRPVKSVKQSGGNSTGKIAAFEFDEREGEILEVKVGISAVDEQGARENMEAEIGNKSFDEVRAEIQEKWERQLEKVVVESEDQDQKTVFYTSLYHTMLAPNLYQDIDGRYRGMDLKIHKTTDFSYYTVFSLWDTYRATHPLYTIIEQERTNDFVNTLLAKYKEGGIMPIWDLSACYTGCMIGYHGVSVISDAYLKGIRGYDADLAFEAVKHSASRDHLGLKAYKSFGFIPVEEESESVSKTLEYAYDDWTIAQLAKALNKTEDYRYFLDRSLNYRNVFDPETKFMRGRFRNQWFSPFDPYEVNFNYTEANAWQYSLYVPQDISGLMEIMGGKTELESRLDELFEAETSTTGRNQADITGLIGQYAHGNEPSHHMAYLYNFVGRPDKTQARVNQILNELYSNAPDGISGNEDCGQMSAWYVFSALGFYPVTPGSPDYIIGAPLFKRATIRLENGNTFTVMANGRNSENYFVKSARLNGRPIEQSLLLHDDIMKGGTLEFEMTDRPTKWMSSEKELPVSKIEEGGFLSAPFIAEGALAFSDSTSVRLSHIQKDVKIFFKINEDPFQLYESLIKITTPVQLDVYAEQEGRKSPVVSTRFTQIDPLVKISLESRYANQYNAGGDRALIDGILGTRDFRTGSWQGYQDQDVVAMVDLGRERSVKSVQVNFLQDQRSWIFLPTAVRFYGSRNGTDFIPLNPGFQLNNSRQDDAIRIKNVECRVPESTYRFIKLVAKKLGDLPSWHIGAKDKGKSWIFIDEIIID